MKRYWGYSRTELREFAADMCTPLDDEDTATMLKPVSCLFVITELRCYNRRIGAQIAAKKKAQKSRVLNLSKLGLNLDNFFFFEKRFV